jgi:hypothetical protein
MSNQSWFEVKYTDIETLEDYSTDIQADDAEDAKRIFELTTKNFQRFPVYSVYSK